jgi:hypothetical protein
LLKELEKDKDPEINQEWIPTGPIISCNGCGKTFTEKTEKGLGKRIGAGVRIFYIIHREDPKDYADFVDTIRKTNSK